MKGTKVERPKGSGRWVLRVEAGRDPLTGKRRRIARTFHGRARDADRELARLITEQSVGRSSGTAATLAVLLDRWMQLAGPDLSPTTRKEYRRLIRARIVPALGHAKLHRLDGVTIDAFYRALLDDPNDPLGAPSVIKIHAIIHRACEQALKWGWLTRNPADQATRPKHRRREINMPEADAVVRLFAKASGWFSTYLIVTACSGARRGEIAGLQWEDVLWHLGEIRIAGNVIEDDDGDLIKKTTKTDRARTVALPGVAVEALRLHREQMEERAAHFAGELEPESFVFSPSPRGEQPYHPDTMTSYFTRLREGSGFDGRLHDLRHGHISMLLAAGVDLATVVQRGGHSNSRTTVDIYGHRVASADRAAADLFGELLAREDAELEVSRLSEAAVAGFRTSTGLSSHPLTAGGEP